MIKKHYVVVKQPDGNPKFDLMKPWLRQYPQYLPQKLDITASTSHQLRRALRNNGWELVELSDKILMIKPDENDDISFAADFLEDDSNINADQDEGVLEAFEKITFGLERDLQAALRNNIEQLELGLKIIDGNTERVTEAGRLDITAEDSQGNIVVIELKAGTAQSKVIAQILAYMGAVAEETKKPVRGILIAGDFDKKVIWAARAIPNLELKKYSFQFTFDEPK